MADREPVVTSPRYSDSAVLDSCCCCIPLKRGCLILGYFQLTMFILAGIMAIVGIAAGLSFMYSDKDEEYHQIGLIMLIVNVVLILMILISLPFTIVLLVGLHKDNRTYIKVYLIYAVICLSIYVVATIARYCKGYGTMNDLLSALLGIALNIYFLLVLRSHHIKLGWGNDASKGYQGGQVMTHKA